MPSRSSSISFEGPLDLLLHLIKKNEVNIHDIPIALITQQYLDAIGLMQELNLDVAGEFLVMAATLIHIKSKMLLPRPETAAGVEGDEEDPRDALVRRLLEHQKFKAAAELLHEREQVRSAQWQRPDERVAALAGDDYEPELEVDLFSLLSAFQAVVERAKQRPKVLAAARADVRRGAHRAAACAAVGNRGVRLRGAVRRRPRSRRPHRHVSRAARDDSTEAGEGVPVGQLRADPRLQARAAGRCAASDWRSGGKPWGIKTRKCRMAGGRMAGQGRNKGRQDRAGQRAEGGGQAGRDENAPERGSAELKAILEALIFASPEPLTPKAI